MPNHKLKVAIIHDWLIGMRGGEQALDSLCKIFPQAEIFTLFYQKGALTPNIENRPVHESFLGKIPGIKDNYRNFLPFFPLAIESFDLKGFDLIISSSHCVAKGIKKPQNCLHICYCYTPMRYAWVFFEQYFGCYPPWKKAFVRKIIDNLKDWDLKTITGVDEFIAISKNIQDRVKAVYSRDSRVIYPPVDIHNFNIPKVISTEDYYLCVSALVPYKKVDIIIDAFNQMPDKKLQIIGNGDIKSMLENKILSDNIALRDWVKKDELIRAYQNARAFVYAAEEDFGIACVEAQAAGLPVIAFGKGGSQETVIPLKLTQNKETATGIFFEEQNSGSLIKAIQCFEENRKAFSAQNIRENALKFSEVNFIKNFQDFLEEKGIHVRRA